MLYRMVNRAPSRSLRLHDMERPDPSTTEQSRRVRLRSFAGLRGTAAIVAKLVLAACCAGAGVSLAAQASSAAPYGLAARHACAEIAGDVNLGTGTHWGRMLLRRSGNVQYVENLADQHQAGRCGREFTEQALAIWVPA